MNNKLVLYIFFLVSCLLAAYFFSFREFNTTVAWSQNDTFNYYWYYNCVNSTSELSYCNNQLGMNVFEIMLAFLAKVTYFFSNSHELFFTAVSIVLFISLITFHQDLGYYSLLVVPLTLLSYSFWELHLNIIRNALSISFFLFSITYKNKKNVFLLLSVLSHTTGILYTFLYTIVDKFKIVHLLITLFIFIALPISATDLFVLALSKIPVLNSTTIVTKLTNYTLAFKSEFTLVNIIGKVYLLVTFLLYFTINKIGSDKAHRIYKLLLIILIFGCLLESTSVVYRIINIYTIFVFYLTVYGMTKRVKLSYVCYSLCLSWSLWNFYLKGDFILRFLD